MDSKNSIVNKPLADLTLEELQTLKGIIEGNVQTLANKAVDFKTNRVGAFGKQIISPEEYEVNKKFSTLESFLCKINDEITNRCLNYYEIVVTK